MSAPVNGSKVKRRGAHHDAIITTYNPTDLRGFVNAGVPQLGLAALSGPEGAKVEDHMRRMAALHQRVALLEMTP